METSKQSSFGKSWTDSILKQWQDEHIDLNECASVKAVLNAEKVIDFVFLDQFKELYAKINGFRGNDWRVNMFSIWPIERIVEEYLSNGNKTFVGFADFLINSHQIGFSKVSEGIFKYHDRPEFISETFEEAILLINADSPIIYV